MKDKSNINDLISEMESLRIDVENSCQYCDPTGMLRRIYERANEMLDDCERVVSKYLRNAK